MQFFPFTYFGIMVFIVTDIVSDFFHLLVFPKIISRENVNCLNKIYKEKTYKMVRNIL